jgi:hypothetical protein
MSITAVESATVRMVSGEWRKVPVSALSLSALVVGMVMAAQIPAQAPERRDERRGEFGATLENGTLSIAIDCSPERPCNARFGSVVHAVKGAARIKPQARTSGPIFIYMDPSGDLVAESPVNLQCEGCRYARGVGQFPANSIALFMWTIREGAFDARSALDFRASLSTTNVTAGSGALVADNGGTATVAIDPTVVGTRVIVPPKSSSSACASGQFSFDGDYYYVCVATNKWKRVALSNF